jgi:hypothetical protein
MATLIVNAGFCHEPSNTVGSKKGFMFSQERLKRWWRGDPGSSLVDATLSRNVTRMNRTRVKSRKMRKCGAHRPTWSFSISPSIRTRPSFDRLTGMGAHRVRVLNGGTTSFHPMTCQGGLLAWLPCKEVALQRKLRWFSGKPGRHAKNYVLGGFSPLSHRCPICQAHCDWWQNDEIR